jgi:hypothetical protein
MNLAGPGTGLMMMTPQNVLTSNFFSEAGYYTNGIFHVKTATELLKALNNRNRDQLQEVRGGRTCPGSLMNSRWAGE